ncbi:tetratricopeptide repeat protein [Ferrovibrio terrae]|uniref:tetratricopeptide repeat protein n=1 Tax=Ferrovibrio terrae TaxID=2594003 RepID=UPI00313828FF
MRPAIAILALALLAGGCSKDFSTTNMARYHDAGTRAESSRDYQGAEENYERALVWAGTEKVPPAMLSLTLYNLGRMKGHGCKFEEARELLLTSLALEEATSGPASTQISRRLFELARLFYDRKQYAEALPYYAQAIPMVRQLKLENENPVAFTDALQEYATSLRQTGDPQTAESLAAEVSNRRIQHADARPQYLIVRYTAICRSTTLVQAGRA